MRKKTNEEPKARERQDVERSSFVGECGVDDLAIVVIV